MADFWGPGLDAELAYRHERLFTALRHTPYGDTQTSAVATTTTCSRPRRSRARALR